MAIWDKFKSYFGIGQPGLGQFGSDISSAWRKYLDLDRRVREARSRQFQRYIAQPIRRKIEDYKREYRLAPQARQITTEYLTKRRLPTPKAPLLTGLFYTKPSEIIQHRQNLEELLKKKKPEVIGVGLTSGGLQFGKASPKLLQQLAKTKKAREIAKLLEQAKIKVAPTSKLVKSIAPLKDPKLIAKKISQFAEAEPTLKELTKALHGKRAKPLKITQPLSIDEVKMKGEKIPEEAKEAALSIAKRVKYMGRSMIGGLGEGIRQQYTPLLYDPSRVIDSITGTSLRKILAKDYKNLLPEEKLNLFLHKWLYPVGLDAKIKTETARLVKKDKVLNAFRGLTEKMREAVHAYGSKKISDDKLVAQFGKEGAGRIKQAAKVLRQEYNNWWRSLNAIRKKYGLKPINKLPNYMHQIGEPLWGRFRLGSIGETFGVAHPTGEVAKSRVGLAKKRVIGYKPTDALLAYEDFIKQAVSHKYSIPYVERWRTFAKLLERAQHETETGLAPIIDWVKRQANILAGAPEKANVLGEDFIQKTMPSVVKGINLTRGLYGMSTVFGRLSSAIAQFSQLPIIFARDPVAATKALLDTAIRPRGDKAIELSSFLKARYKDIPSNLITAKNLLNKGGMWLLEQTESIVGRTAWKTEFYRLLKKGLDPKKAAYYADLMAGRIMGSRALGTRPQFYESTLGKTAGQFMLEVNNLFNYLIHDIGMSPKDAWEMGKVLVNIHLFNRLLQKITGYPTNIDPIQAIIDAYGELREETENKTEAISKAVGRVIGEVLANHPLGGWLADMYPEYGMELFGVRLSTKREFFGKSGAGMFGVAPISGMFRNLPFSIIPFGKQFQKTTEGLDFLRMGGRYPGSLYLQSDEERKKKGLLYPAPTSKWERAKAVLFGASSTQPARHYYEEIKRPFGEKLTRFYDLMTKGGKTNTDKVYQTIEMLRKREREGGVATLSKEEKKRYEKRKEEVIRDLLEKKMKEPSFEKLSPEEQLKWVDKIYGKATALVNREFGLTKEPDSLPIRDEDILLYQLKNKDQKKDYVDVWNKYYSDIYRQEVLAKDPESALKYVNKRWALAKDLFVVAKNPTNYEIVKEAGMSLYNLYEELKKDPMLTEEERKEIEMRQVKILSAIADRYAQLVRRLQSRAGRSTTGRSRRKITPKVVKRPSLDVGYRAVGVPRITTSAESALRQQLQKYRYEGRRSGGAKIKPITKL